MRKSIKITLMSLLLFIVLSAFAIINEPLINLEGITEINLNLGDEYIEMGYSGKTRLLSMNDKVKITNNINNKKIGKYEVKYKLKFLFNTKTVVRHVNVVDNIKPELTLIGKTELKMCPNAKYKEEGYTVIDNYDKNLEKKVKIKRTNKEIIYSVKDSSGNIDQKTRKIISSDNDGPNITVSGDDVIIVKKGSQFKKPEYKAIDNCDGNLTNKVKIEGKIDTKKIGTQKLTYKVKDSTGNESIKYKTVYVTDKENNNGGIIYLTFDDGPSESTTPVILDILKSEGVSATFFVTDKDDSLDYLIKREDKEGHTVALHTATHNYSYVYSSKEAYFEDLKRVSDEVKRIIGKESKIIRFPGGSSNTVSIRYSPGLMSYLTNEVQKRGYRYFDWNVDSEDATRRVDADSEYAKVTQGLRPGRENVVLMHDFGGNEPTKNSLRRIIKYGKEKGYIFATLTESSFGAHHPINN